MRRAFKTCRCGNEFFEIPRGARFSTDPDFGGAYWECPKCKTTLFLRQGADRERARLEELLTGLKELQSANCAEHCAGAPNGQHRDPLCIRVLSLIAEAEGVEAEPCISCGEPVFDDLCDCQDEPADGARFGRTG